MCFPKFRSCSARSEWLIDAGRLQLFVYAFNDAGLNRKRNPRLACSPRNAGNGCAGSQEGVAVEFSNMAGTLWKFGIFNQVAERKRAYTAKNSEFYPI